MSRLAWSVLFALLLLSPVRAAFAQNTGVPGFWKTFYDDGKPKSIVKLWEEGGKLRGRVVKVYVQPERICDKCEGSLHNKPMVGLSFLWGFVRDTDNPNKWVDGEIVDPKDGKQYHCQMELTEGGKKLEVFGYIRMLIKVGKTQVWVRAAQSDLPPVAAPAKSAPSATPPAAPSSNTAPPPKNAKGPGVK
jgi:uncharacterized protein (DUF2147 family)